MDDDRLLPYLVELVGSRLRIDHDYCIFMRRGAGSNNLHGGPWRYESDHWYRYHDGEMRNGLTVATWNLTDVGPGDGGFACVPGSHKSNFLQHMPRDVARFERREDWVVQPTMAAGDVLIFTEALIHGTTAWTADHERRTLLYKYSPPHSTWTKRRLRSLRTSPRRRIDKGDSWHRRRWKRIRRWWTIDRLHCRHNDTVADPRFAAFPGPRNASRMMRRSRKPRGR